MMVFNMSSQIQTLKNQIKELQEKIKKEEEKELLSAHIPKHHKEIAELLHSKMCHANHSDGCGWYYDNGTWTEYSRKTYLHKAQVLANKYDTETLLEIFNSI
jgi:uncharacterized protein (UPF0216 family)